MNESNTGSRKSPRSSTSATRRRTRRTQPSPIEPVLDSCFHALRHLVRMQRAIIHLSRPSEGAVANTAAIERQLAESWDLIWRQSRAWSTWIEEPNVSKLLNAAQETTREVARLALRLHRVGGHILRLSDVLDQCVTITTMDADGRTPKSQSTEPICLQTSASMADIKAYLAQVDLPSLQAAADELRLRLVGSFVPTRNQRRLHETLTAHGPLKKEALAARLKADPSKLYDRWGLTQLMDLEYVASGSDGYSAIGELPRASPRAKNRRSLAPI